MEARMIKQILYDFAMATCIDVSLNKSKVFSLTLTLLFKEISPELLGFKGTSYLPSIWAYLS